MTTIQAMMRIYNMKKTIILISFIAAMLNVMVCNAGPRSFTLLIYMNGSNLESKNKLATFDIQEMMHALTRGNTGDDFTILLLMGGTSQWHTEEVSTTTIPNDSITYAEITDKGFHKVRTFRNASIGRPGTLTDFINFGKETYRSDEYGLIFWNHGAGSVTGFGYDELFPDDASLSLKEIQRGLDNASLSHPEKFTFIGFDACLMASIETASAVAPYADYLIASQELEPGGGWDYRSVISTLRQQKGKADESAYQAIVNSFVESYREDEKEQVTLSAIRLSQIGLLSDCIGQFFLRKRQQLAKDISVADATSYQRYSNARTKTKSFGMPTFTFYGPDMADVWDLCRNIGNTEDSSLLDSISTAIGNAVVCAGKSLNLEHENICGLSVYFPCYNIGIAQHLKEYYLCGFNEAYLDFIKVFSNELLSGYKGTGSITAFDDEMTETLSTDMILNTRKIYSVVLAETADKRWVSYGLDGDGVTLNSQGQIVRLDEKGNIIKEWDKKWISIGGKNVSAYMSFTSKNSLNYTVPVLLNGERFDLIVGYDAGNPSGKVYGARRIINEQIPDKGMTPIQAGDTLVFLHKIFNEERETTEYVPSSTMVALKKKHLRVGISPVAEGYYRYGYCLVDLYGRKHYTRFSDYRKE